MSQPDSALRPPRSFRLLRCGRRVGLPFRWRLSVPAAFVTGSVGKTTTCSMVAAVLAAAGRRVGLTTSMGCYLAGRRMRSGDSSRPAWAAAVAADPAIDAGVFETARGGLLLDGFPFQGRTVGAMLNVQDNHLGAGGVRSREELARVKALVVTRATELAVLNADDPLCLAVRPRVRARATCLVSPEPGNAAVGEHRARGGLVACLDPARDGGAATLRLLHGDRELVALPAAEIPAAFGGRFEPVVTNALHAMAIAHGLGVDGAAIRHGLATFRSDERDNPGRMNVHHGLPYSLVLTKADGTATATALARHFGSLEMPGRRTLVLSSMGNRSDEWIRGVGRAFAAAFDRFVCCDWTDPRGRPRGETARLLAAGLAEAGADPAAIAVEPDHDEAIRTGGRSSGAGDLLVVVSFSSWRAPEILGFRPAGAGHVAEEAA
jgi:cyanophycin synthetase